MFHSYFLSHGVFFLGGGAWEVLITLFQMRYYGGTQEGNPLVFTSSGRVFRRPRTASNSNIAVLASMSAKLRLMSVYWKPVGGLNH